MRSTVVLPEKVVVAIGREHGDCCRLPGRRGRKRMDHWRQLRRAMLLSSEIARNAKHERHHHTFPHTFPGSPFHERKSDTLGVLAYGIRRFRQRLRLHATEHLDVALVAHARRACTSETELADQKIED